MEDKKSVLNPENRIYVGNLPLSLDGRDLTEIFSPFGKVVDAKVLVDKYYKRSKGYGFVTFSSKAEVKKAIEEMNGEEFQGRKLNVKASELEKKD
jgi:RNA recognition motif-containing protein